MNLKTIFVFLAMVVALSACKSSQHSAETTLRPKYGTPGANKIQVTIVGDVKNPGVYWIDRSVSLVRLPKVAGGWTGHGEFGVSPSKAIVTNSEAAKSDRKVHQLKQLGFDERNAIRFREGDVIYFPRVFF